MARTRGAIVRRLDDLGRVVIPSEIRTELGIEHGTPMLIAVDDSNIVVTPVRFPTLRTEEQTVEFFTSALRRMGLKFDQTTLEATVRALAQERLGEAILAARS